MMAICPVAWTGQARMHADHSVRFTAYIRREGAI